MKKDCPILRLVVYDGRECEQDYRAAQAMNPSREVLVSANRDPGQISWDYNRAEIIADGVVHAIGVCLGLIGAVTIVVIAVRIERIEVAPILVYVIGLVSMLALSAAYNMWPVSPAKWVLRRFERVSVVLCLLVGWSGVIAYDSFASALPSASLWLLAIGGILYSVGALFHVWQGLRFHNAIWHGFVLIAASCHYSALLACLPWA